MRRFLYMIDGVAVPRKIWERRQIWGEYAGASFFKYEIRSDFKSQAGQG
jgi:hypothetical protein